MLTIVCCALTLLSVNNCLLCPHLVVAAFHQVLFYGDRVLDVDILVELLRGKKFQLLQSSYIIIKIVHLHPISTYVSLRTSQDCAFLLLYTNHTCHVLRECPSIHNTWGLHHQHLEQLNTKYVLSSSLSAHSTRIHNKSN